MNIVRLGRQSVRVCFVLMLFYVFALGPGSMAGASPMDSATNASAADLRVSGRFLLSANGGGKEKNKRPFDMAISDYFDGNDLVWKKLYGDRPKPEGW